MSAWRKSTHSGGGEGGCVEVGEGCGDVLVRDTKQSHLGEGRTTLRLTREDFRKLTSTIKQDTL